jgi:hypothetical protein
MSETAASTRIAHLVPAIGLLVLTAAYLNSALGFSFGSWSAPRAGFMPTIVGVLGTGLASINLVAIALKQPGRADLGELPVQAFLVAGTLFAYLPLLMVAGYIPATALVLVALIKVFGGKGWVLPIAIAAAASGATFVLFEHLLSLPLP